MTPEQIITKEILVSTKDFIVAKVEQTTLTNFVNFIFPRRDSIFFMAAYDQ